MRTRWSFAIMAGLVFFSVLRALVATRTDAFTIDEPWHIVAGASHLRDGDYRLNPEQPPLVKLVAAAAVPGLVLPPLPPIAGKVGERRFIDDVMFLANDADAIQARVRIAMSIMNGLLLVLLAAAIWRLFGPLVAGSALLFLAIDPSIAANIPIVMTDLPIALAGTSAVLFAVAALAKRRPTDLVLAIFSFAIAMGAKHSGPIVAVTLVFVSVLVLVVTRKEPRFKFALAATVLLFAGAWALLWAMYRFRFHETNGSGDRTNTELALKIADVQSGTIRSALNLAVRTHTFPRAYLWGLADTVRAGAEGRGITVVLLGTAYRNRGPFYQWPVVIAAKLPLGLTLLTLIGFGVLIRYGVRQSWRLPLAAIAALAAVFLFFLMRGAAYAGIRHALPLLPPLAIVAGVGCAELITRRSRLGMSVAAVAIVAAAISAVPKIRPWEYYNEGFGGPDGAYRHFSDEGLDVGQRTKDLARYCKEQLEPRGIKPYVLYAISPQEEKSRGLKIRSNRSDDLDDGNDDPLITGTFLVQAKAILRNEGIRALRDARPSGRIGNLLMYTGTYRLPSLRSDPLRRKADRLLHSDKPDRAEKYLLRLVKLEPSSAPAYTELGNINLRRRATPEAIRFYSIAEGVAQNPVMKAALHQQIALLNRGGPDLVKPVRVPERE
jgi:hypothetical protein